MGSKRKIIEIAAGFLFFIAAALFADIHGKLHRTFLPVPQVEIVQEPSYSFPLWNANNLRGRILVVFDRHLNAEFNDGDFLFSPGEFSNGYSLDVLCRHLGDDLGLREHPDFDCTIDSLNGLLKTMDIYTRLKMEHMSTKLPSETKLLLGSSRRFIGMGFRGPKSDEQDFLRFNRLLLETRYPQCPKSHLVTHDNYVYQAIEADIVREIYHVVPDDAWLEVKTALQAYPETVSNYGDVFRMVLYEGTPVFILRSKDIPDISEKVLLDVNGDYYPRTSIALVADMLKSGRLRSDLVTISGSGARENAATIGGI